MLLEVLNRRNNALGSQLLDLCLFVLFPVFHVVSISHTEGSSSVDQGTLCVVESSRNNEVFVNFGCTSLLGGNKSSSNPDSLGSPRQVGGQTSAVVDSSGSDDIDGSASEGALVALYCVDTCRDKDTCRGISSVTSTLASLCTDEVDTNCECFGDVLGVANHVHYGDASFVEGVNGLAVRDTDSTNKELGALFDDHFDEVRQLTLGVIILQFCLVGI